MEDGWVIAALEEALPYIYLVSDQPSTILLDAHTGWRIPDLSHESSAPHAPLWYEMGDDSAIGGVMATAGCTPVI